MYQAQRIVSDKPLEGKLIAALCTLFSLRLSAIIAIVGTALVVILFAFSLMVDALVEVCSHIAQVWNESNAIERLLIFILAWIVFYKLSPYIAKACRKGF